MQVHGTPHVGRDTPVARGTRYATERWGGWHTAAMSNRPEVMDRAQVDLDAGRPWNAANRLQGYLVHDPLNEPVRLMLGEVLLGMGELAVAGRALLPSERDDEPAREAIDAWLAELETLDAHKVHLVHRQGFTNGVLLRQLGPIGRARTEPVVDRVREALDGEVDFQDAEATLAEKVGLGCVSLGCGGAIAVFIAGLVQIWKWLGL